MNTFLPETELNSWEPGKTYTAFFPKDWHNYLWQKHYDSVPISREIQEAITDYYPVSQELQDFVAEQATDWKSFEERVEKMLAGIDESEENDLSPWIPGDFFLPLENPNNSTDYQDDFDPQDFAADSWESEDGIDDHHIDPYLYSEVAMNENPIFNEDGSIEWENISDADLDSPDSEKRSEFVKRVMENLFDAEASNPYFFHSQEARDELTVWVSENLSDTDMADSDLLSQDEFVEWTLNEMQMQAMEWETESLA